MTIKLSDIFKDVENRLRSGNTVGLTIGVDADNFCPIYTTIEQNFGQYIFCVDYNKINPTKSFFSLKMPTDKPWHNLFGSKYNNLVNINFIVPSKILGFVPSKRKIEYMGTPIRNEQYNIICDLLKERIK